MKLKKVFLLLGLPLILSACGPIGSMATSVPEEGNPGWKDSYFDYGHNYRINSITNSKIDYSGMTMVQVQNTELISNSGLYKQTENTKQQLIVPETIVQEYMENFKTTEEAVLAMMFTGMTYKKVDTNFIGEKDTGSDINYYETIQNEPLMYCYNQDKNVTGSDEQYYKAKVFEYVGIEDKETINNFKDLVECSNWNAESSRFEFDATKDTSGNFTFIKKCYIYVESDLITKCEMDLQQKSGDTIVNVEAIETLSKCDEVVTFPNILYSCSHKAATNYYTGKDSEGNRYHCHKCQYCSTVLDYEKCTFDDNGKCTICNAQPSTFQYLVTAEDGNPAIYAITSDITGKIIGFGTLSKYKDQSSSLTTANVNLLEVTPRSASDELVEIGEYVVDGDRYLFALYEDENDIQCAYIYDDYQVELVGEIYQISGTPKQYLVGQLFK